MNRTRLSTGIDGLDEVLNGGLLANRSYMFRGPAGSGKTIMGFHFLEAGLEAGESVLFVNLEEDVEDLRENAAALGFTVDEIDVLDLSPAETVFTEDESYQVFQAADVEQEPVTEAIVETVQAVTPDRVFVDPLTQLWYLTSGEYDFRKQIIGFTRFLKSEGATVCFTAQETETLPTEDLQFVSDGTIRLDSTPAGRRVDVPKFRGSSAQRGEHAFRITDEGITVYPELAPEEGRSATEMETLSSGVSEVDDLLHGGVERGTVTVISGPTGVGKTTLGTQFVNEAASRGERSVIFLFEETEETFLTRSRAVDIPVESMVDRGTLRVEEVDALDLSPQEFGQRVRHEVEDRGTEIVMIDGITGYRLTLGAERDQTIQRLHALGRYLKNAGATTIMVDETTDVTGKFYATEESISYLADNIVFLRHLELNGELQKAIGVLKKRTSDHERLLRQYELTADGIRVGAPLSRLRGVLTGTPEEVDRE